MQDTWEKRLAYLQVTVELIAMSSEKQSTHNQSYAQPVSHLFETAVDIAVQGTREREGGREGGREILLLTVNCQAWQVGWKYKFCWEGCYILQIIMSMNICIHGDC